jgi:phosphate:Na+ symporter
MGNGALKAAGAECIVLFMAADIMLALGGVGLFLIGMIMLTEGLRGLAGKALRDVLARFTENPFSGAVSGALTTAVVQSSSATTVTAVGFVSAGLLTFPEALGVIFGANIGTTVTGWIVAILGFKLHLGEIILPVVLIGALLKLFGSGRLNFLGTALAGFSLLFIGIDAMQGGLAALEGVVTPSDFPEDTLPGRLKLVLIGIAITVVTQSSSAGVATALVGLAAGAISFEQAAAMVIGMNVGTTSTALLATLGGSTATRRTGYAHVIYNVMTGVVAFILLGPFVSLVRAGVGQVDVQIALVAFHTSFNVIGVALVLPFTNGFARLVTALVPERGPHLTRHLGKRLLSDADAATDAAVATVEEISQALFALLAHLLGARQQRRGELAKLSDSSEAVGATRAFVEKIVVSSADEPRGRRIVAAFHILDHLGRLYFRCTHTERIATLAYDRRLRRLRNVLRGLAQEAVDPADPLLTEERLDRLRKLLLGQIELFRERTIGLVSTGRIAGEAAMRRLDSVRWLQRVSYHLWRIQHHRNLLGDIASPASPLTEAEAEAEIEKD